MTESTLAWIRRWLALTLLLFGSATALLAGPLDHTLRETLPRARSGVTWAYAVESLTSGTDLASRYSDEPLKPASSLKALTCGVAMDLLGPDHRIPTTVYADGSISGGVLRGDLWVLGLGDPTYNGRHSDSASAAMRNLADSIREAGVTSVRGDIVITGLFVYADGYGAVQTLGRGADNLALSNDRRDRGRLTPTDRGTARIVSQDDFTREANRAAGERLRRTLREIGVSVSGSVRTSRDLTPPGRRIARRLSPPLDSIIRRVLLSSINLHADLLLLYLGYHEQGSIRLSAGIETVTDWLEEHGTSTSGMRLVDGSGLSHRNLMTANQLLAVARNLSRSEHFNAWRNCLPVAGESGTLATRMRGTPAQDNLRAKTGTLTGAATLVGYVRDQANGELCAFAIIENSPYENPIDRSTARRYVDRLATVIARGVAYGGLPVDEGFAGRTDTRWTLGGTAREMTRVQRDAPDHDGWAGRLISRGEGAAWAVTGAADTDNVAIESWVNISYDTRVEESSEVPYQGLVFRAEGDDWVRFVADFDRDRTLKVQAHIDGRWQRLANWTFPDDFSTPGPGWHLMRVELRGSQLRAFFDGRELPGGPLTIQGRPQGQSGVFVHHWGSRSGERRAHFDGFSVTPLN